jgi:hypothetical protein
MAAVPRKCHSLTRRKEQEMKRILLTSLVFAFVTLLGSAIAFADIKGNGLPPGPRYMLNVIAFDNCPAGDFTGSNRHMIAVQSNFGTIDPDNSTTSNQAGTLYRDMVKTNTISLTSTPAELGNVFEVLDGNACSKGGAEFRLPADPYDCGTGTTNDPNCVNEDLTFQEYQVFVRLVGKPNTKIGVTTCAVDDMDTQDPSDDAIVCSTENVIRVRMTGKGSMQFSDVSKQLLTVCLDTDASGTCDTRYALFDPALYGYFWQWNTDGKAHAQLVFIPVPD